MKSLEELNKLYESYIKPRLADLETNRKNIKKLRILSRIFVILCLLAIPSLWLLIVMTGDYVLAFFLTPPALFIVARILFVISKSEFEEYRQKFKQIVMSKLMELINLDYDYYPDKCIAEKDAYASKLFANLNNSVYAGNDLVTGIIDKTPFLFSELDLRFYNKEAEKPEDVKYQAIIFKGLLFMAEFNKNLNESSFVVPAKSHSNVLGKEKSQVKRFGKLIKLENPEFERIFSVYGTSEQEARYILTPTMMEAMVAVYKKFDFAMKFSFIGSKVYCTIPMKKDMFEPNIKRGIKFKDVEEFYTILDLIETIITEMNLNIRIWTKE